MIKAAALGSGNAARLRDFLVSRQAAGQVHPRDRSPRQRQQRRIGHEPAVAAGFSAALPTRTSRGINMP
jgi:hypothetical protein